MSPSPLKFLPAGSTAPSLSSIGPVPDSLDIVSVLISDADSPPTVAIPEIIEPNTKIINVKGRDFIIENFYEGIVRFNFNELCNQNLGAEDYLEIIKNCKFIVIDQIPQFDDSNSNQQQRFITLLDIIYEKNIPISVTANQNLDKFTSSKLLEKPFKRTISRLYELTSVD